MTAITASLIKTLREATGAGMMDCKKALNECDGDFEAAKDWLRKKGIGAAAKKAGRAATEGLIAIDGNDQKAAIIELNSETDFLAKSDKFQKFVLEIAQVANDVNGDFDKLSSATLASSGKNTIDTIKENVGEFGENMNLRRSDSLSIASDGVIATYIHNAVASNLGKIGVLVALESTGDKVKLQELGKQLAMHIAAIKPEALDRSSVDAAQLERERAIYLEQAKASGKPDNIAEKMVEGRVNKYYAQVVLLEQAFVIDGKTKVADAIAAVAKEIGADIKLSGYIQYSLGEGLEKAEDNFAQEVAKAAGAA